MMFTLSCCVAYCISMSVVCGYFAFNLKPFTGLESGTSCYAISTANSPVEANTQGA